MNEVFTGVLPLCMSKYFVSHLINAKRCGFFFSFLFFLY